MKPLNVLFAFLLVTSSRASAGEAGHEFVMSCTYGALAGTLVGAASLAFTKHPGDNLNHVARGASLGLYAGILLGTYVAFIVPRLHRGDDEVGATEPAVLVAPTVADGRVDGAQTSVRVLRF